MITIPKTKSQKKRRTEKLLICEILIEKDFELAAGVAQLASIGLPSRKRQILRTSPQRANPLQTNLLTDFFPQQFVSICVILYLTWTLYGHQNPTLQHVTRMIENCRN